MSELLEKARSAFSADITDSHDRCGDDTVIIRREALPKVMKALRGEDDFAFDQVTDITAVDWYGKKSPRFEVVYHLYSYRHLHRLRVKVKVPEDDAVVDTVTGVWKGANWLEREVWDLYGINFRGHPDMRRILLYDEFQGHPLRKDYPIDLRQPLVPARDVDEAACSSIGAAKLDRNCEGYPANYRKQRAVKRK
ncbi:MAG: NADH-quinone oxidoreductase subunit C [Deltaproteobacteria bacterium]|nr:NADH-quinone oxidoreductase subunit C [Deltaproteobacteria bacterium]